MRAICVVVGFLLMSSKGDGRNPPRNGDLQMVARKEKVSHHNYVPTLWFVFRVAPQLFFL
jgi:hypothetical protein